MICARGTLAPLEVYHPALITLYGVGAVHGAITFYSPSSVACVLAQRVIVDTPRKINEAAACVKRNFEKSSAPLIGHGVGNPLERTTAELPAIRTGRRTVNRRPRLARLLILWRRTYNVRWNKLR